MGEPAGGAGESAELCERWGGWTGRSATPQHALARHSRSQQDNRRQGLYYSPPGTSYTIVERPASSHGHHAPHTYGAPAKLTRGGYLGGSAGAFAPGINGKKRPISPEQVLRLLGQGGGAGKDRTRRHSPASSPSSTTHHATYRPEPRPYSSAGLTGGSGMTGPGGGGGSMTGPAIGALDPSTRTVAMSRDMPDATHGFGICVKGGKEAGVGVYISRVEEGSAAERSGLRPGDAILQVNGTPFNGISHEDALKMLKSCRQLSMTVRSGGAGSTRAACSWMDRQGRPASPPPCRPASHHYTPYPSVKDRTIRRVDLCIEPGQSLGLMIRGGLEYNLGIYITGVDKESVADRAGLMIGDQILEVNGQSFMDVTHDEAVGTLKQHKRMSLLVRDVGKVPHSCTAYADRNVLSPSAAGGGGGGVDACEAGEVRAVREARGMVEEKARSLLPASELPALLYYMGEYAQRRMPADAFFTHLLDVLDKPEKLTLLTEMREFVLSEDRARFDELVYRRDHTRHAHKEAVAGAGGVQGGGLEHRSPSEDSGLGLAAHEHAYRSGGRSWARGGDVLLPEDELPPDGLHQDYSDEERQSRRHSSPLGSREGSTAALHRASAGPTSATHPTHPPPAYDDPDQSGYLDGLRSSLGGWTQKVKSWYWGRPLELAHKLSRSFDMKEEGALLDGAGGAGGMRRHQSMQRLGHEPGLDEHARAARVVHDHHGNLHITVKKTKPILGIAIEGGANTKHLLPRIINIHEHGAAYEAGGLEVGQLILSVDGRRVDGMQHQDVARLIAESFAQRDKPNIEFLVVEAKKSNLEPKPTALIFLEA